MPRSPWRRIRLATIIGELEVLRKPGRARNTSADLAPATGARTTRFCRTRAASTDPRSAMCCRPHCSQGVEAPFVCTPFDRSRETRPAKTSRARRRRVHRIPPRVRDDRERPSEGLRLSPPERKNVRLLNMLWKTLPARVPAVSRRAFNRIHGPSRGRLRAGAACPVLL